MITQFNKNYIIKYILGTCCNIFYSLTKSDFFLVIDARYAYYMILHLRFSSQYYTPALIDITAIDLTNTACIYYIFTISNISKLHILAISNKNMINSIECLFKNATWYEREVREMFNYSFITSSDCRNLLLPYGYYKAPLRKVSTALSDAYLKYTTTSDVLQWVLL